MSDGDQNVANTVEHSLKSFKTKFMGDTFNGNGCVEDLDKLSRDDAK